MTGMTDNSRDYWKPCDDCEGNGSYRQCERCYKREFPST